MSHLTDGPVSGEAGCKNTIVLKMALRKIGYIPRHSSVHVLQGVRLAFLPLPFSVAGRKHYLVSRRYSK